MNAALQRRLKALEEQRDTQTTIRVEREEAPFPEIVDAPLFVSAKTAPDNPTQEQSP